MRPSFHSSLERLLTRRSVLVASPLLCALRRWARRAWCVAAGGGTAGVLVLVTSCSACVAFKDSLRFYPYVLVGVVSCSACHVMMAPFLPFHQLWLFTRRFVLVASPLLCALRRWARRGAAGVVCGGGRRHGGRLGFVASCSVYVAFKCWLCFCRSVLVGC